MARRKLLPLALFVCALVALLGLWIWVQSEQRARAAREEVQRLVGTWRLVELHQTSAPFTPEVREALRQRPIKMRFSPVTFWSISNDQEDESMSYRLDPTKTPKRRCGC